MIWFMHYDGNKQHMGTSMFGKEAENFVDAATGISTVEIGEWDET